MDVEEMRGYLNLRSERDRLQSKIDKIDKCIQDAILDDVPTDACVAQIIRIIEG